MAAYRIGVVGCAGRMGRTLVRTIATTDGCAVGGGSERPGNPAVGRDLGTLAGLEPLGLPVGDDPDDLFAAVDAVLDFTAPAASTAHAALAAKHGKVHVIGTTGLEVDQAAALEHAARQTAIVFAPNMSLGVNLLFALVERVARSLDSKWDIEIVEMHHRHKVDAPSGTALTLGEMAAAGRGRSLTDVAQRGRDGLTGERRKGDIGFAALRGGEVVGDHTVMFASDHERIELTHKASSREVFARGAVRAALWVATQKPGRYAMADVLGFTD